MEVVKREPIKLPIISLPPFDGGDFHTWRSKIELLMNYYNDQEYEDWIVLNIKLGLPSKAFNAVKDLTSVREIMNELTHPFNPNYSKYRH